MITNKKVTKRGVTKASTRPRKGRTLEETTSGRHYSLLANELGTMAPDVDIPVASIRKFDKPAGFYVDASHEKVDLNGTWTSLPVSAQEALGEKIDKAIKLGYERGAVQRVVGMSEEELAAMREDSLWENYHSNSATIPKIHAPIPPDFGSSQEENPKLGPVGAIPMDPRLIGERSVKLLKDTSTYNHLEEFVLQLQEMQQQNPDMRFSIANFESWMHRTIQPRRHTSTFRFVRKTCLTLVAYRIDEHGRCYICFVFNTEDLDVEQTEVEPFLFSADAKWQCKFPFYRFYFTCECQ